MNGGWRTRLLTAPHLAFFIWTSLAAIGVLYGSSGQLVFPMDDAYINAGLGRRFFDGTSRGEFPSGTTAFGWSLLFGALSSVIGSWVIAVIFAVNLAGGLWIVSMLAGLLPQRGRSLPEVLFLLWVVVFVNLPLLAVLGMEHLWDAAFVIAALTALGRLLEGERAGDGKLLVAFVLLAALCRQETMFLGISIAIVLAFHRFYRWAACVLAAAFLPVAAQGLLQVLQGKSFAANPIAIKATLWETPAELAALLLNKLIYFTLPLDVSLSIATATIVLFVSMLRPPVGRVVAVSAIAVTTLMYTFAHLAFAQHGWLGRYQVPVLACTVAMLAMSLPNFSPRWTAAATWLLYVPALLFGLIWTALANERSQVLADLPTVSREVVNQMCAIRDIVSLAPKDEPVILNDVGCTTFFLDNPIVDLFGLTAHEVRTLGGRMAITKSDIDSLARRHDARMAIIYKRWFSNRIPDDWVEIGSWTTSTARYAAHQTITVYATKPEWRDEIRERWRTHVRGAGKPDGVRFDE